MINDIHICSQPTTFGWRKKTENKLAQKINERKLNADIIFNHCYNDSLVHPEPNKLILKMD